MKQRLLHSHAAAGSLFSFLLMSVVIAGDDGRRRAADAVSAQGSDATYRYVMKGEVRLLLFWVGKEGVGGGTIRIADDSTLDGSLRRERIEVLFGSNPERVPGGHNRWGYGDETAYWRERGVEAPHLERSLFEGFMRRSNEESLSEVTAKGEDEDEDDEGLFQYTGTRSEVTPSGATAEIRYFSASEDFDYRRAEPIRDGYRKRLADGPPDKRRKLDNRNSYEAPYGFLSATRQLLKGIVAAFQSGETDFHQARPSLTYVYNARLFRLEVEDVEYAESLRLGSSKGDGSEAPLTVDDVVHVIFRVAGLDTDYEHGFTVSIPLGGPLRGVPLRIVDKPRWWLRIELDLAPDEAMRSMLERRATRSDGGSRSFQLRRS